MTDLFTSNTFDEYAIHVEPSASGWKGLSVGKAFELLNFVEFTKAKDLALYKCAKFARLLGVPDEANLIAFKFEDYLPSACSCPVIRQKNGEYVIQIDNYPISLLENKEKFEVVSEGITIKATEEYVVPSFVFTLPNQVETSTSFETKVRFALKVDAVKNNDNSSASDDLLALFKIDPGAPATLSMVAEFKENSGFTLARDLQPGLYPWNKFEIVEQSKTENNKVNKWKCILLSCVDGTVVNIALNSEIGKFFANDMNCKAYKSAIERQGFCTLYISQVEEKMKGTQVVKAVHGTIFHGIVPPALVARFNVANLALKSAEVLPTLDVTNVVQTLSGVAVQTESSLKKATKNKAKEIQPALVPATLSDDEAPDFDSL